MALRDFLIQLKEFSGDDNAELFLEEKEAEQQMKAQTEREQAMRIPGMLKPDQLEDKDEDIWAAGHWTNLSLVFCPPFLKL